MYFKHLRYYFVFSRLISLDILVTMSSKTRNRKTVSGNSELASDLHKMTIVQLRAKLNEHNILNQKSDKKSKLIELVISNGLDTSNIPDDHEDVTELQTLTKTVSELQKTVFSLTGTVQKLQQKDRVTATVSSADTEHNTEAIQERDSNLSISGPADQNDLLGAGGASKFGYSAETLPFIETVHPTLKKQIIEGKDVNLAALLIPFYSGQHSDTSFNTNNYKDKPDPRLNTSLTLAQFIQAFAIYKNIMCEAYPTRRLELDLYERDIVDMATRYSGKGFYEYHKSFSAEAAAHLKYSNKKVDWSLRNNKLFATIFVNHPANSCNLCQSTLHMTAFCPNQLNKWKNQIPQGKSPSSHVDIRGRTRIQFNGQEICNNFNTVRGCVNSRCRNAHVCLICKKEHSQLTCN